MLFTGLGRSVWEKNCALGLEWPYSRPREQFFPIRTSHPVNNIYIFECSTRHLTSERSERERCRVLTREDKIHIHKRACNILFITYMPEFLKTGLAKIRTHSTTWQLKTTRFVQRPIKKPISDAGQ